MVNHPMYLEDIFLCLIDKDIFVLNDLPGGHFDFADLREGAVVLDPELADHQALGHHHQHVGRLVVQQRSKLSAQWDRKRRTDF